MKQNLLHIKKKLWEKYEEIDEQYLELFDLKLNKKPYNKERMEQLRQQKIAVLKEFEEVVNYG